MGKGFSKGEMVFMHVFIRSISINLAIRENFFKLQNRWYTRSVRVHKMFPEVDASCWRCKKEKGDLKHICWACEKLQQFWKVYTRK